MKLLEIFREDPNLPHGFKQYILVRATETCNDAGKKLDTLFFSTVTSNALKIIAQHAEGDNLQKVARALINENMHRSFVAFSKFTRNYYKIKYLTEPFLKSIHCFEEQQLLEIIKNFNHSIIDFTRSLIPNVHKHYRPVMILMDLIVKHESIQDVIDFAEELIPDNQTKIVALLLIKCIVNGESEKFIEVYRRVIKYNMLENISENLVMPLMHERGYYDNIPVIFATIGKHFPDIFDKFQKTCLPFLSAESILRLVELNLVTRRFAFSSILKQRNSYALTLFFRLCPEFEKLNGFS